MPSGSTQGTGGGPPVSYSVPGEGSTPVPLWEPPAPLGDGSPETPSDGVRLALRLLVQLDRVGGLGPNGDGRPEATQEGLAEALHVTQGAVSKVLGRLMAVNIVAQERRHVRGRDRRVRVYFLSREGVGLAREIELRFGLASPHQPGVKVVRESG